MSIANCCIRRKMRQMTIPADCIDSSQYALGIGDSIVQEFYGYWREDYALVNRDMGCMIICMASKLDLLNDEMKMHHGNAHEFAKAHGADDDTAKQIVTILHECESSPSTEDDPCLRALEISKCFRSRIHELKWAPNMEVVLEEVMTGVKT
ncbi:unnamed protein product [Arctia plantaginis]|uniref:Uncharacterized protein n=1 Tax=Arctia plantaginis TaxID=874455 RepID=A0A8S1AF53_ARCPL|nr:unnamed protein product [Arctia plantaginis]